MNKRLLSIILPSLLLFILGCQTTDISGKQSDASDSYVILHYKQIPEADEKAYLEIEKFWQQVHQKRISEGRMRAWFLYKVRPNKNQPFDYNYVTANVYPSNLKGKEISVSREDFLDVYGEEYMAREGQEMFEQTKRVNNIIREDSIKPMDATLYTPGKLRRVNFIKVKDGMKEDFLQSRKAFHQAVFNQVVQDPESSLSGWFLAGLVETDAGNNDYDYMTHDIFMNSAMLNQPGTGKDYGALAFPELSSEQRQVRWTRFNQMKRSMRREIWEVKASSLSDRSKQGVWAFEDSLFKSEAGNQTANLKVYSGDQFAVLHLKNGTIAHVHAGEVRTENGKTVETVYANSDSEDSIIGREFAFNVDFGLDQFVQSGVGPLDGRDWVETWKRAGKQIPNSMGIAGTWIRDLDDPNRKMIKFIQGKTWFWIVVDRTSGRISNALGGVYQYDGQNYSETPTFHFKTPNWLGQPFAARLDKKGENLALEIPMKEEGRESTRKETWYPMAKNQWSD